MSADEYDEELQNDLELTALRAEVERLQERFDAVRDAAHAEAKRVFPATVIESHFGGELHADDLCSMLAAEVERLRAAMLGIGLAITAYDASSDRARSDYDMVCAGGRLYDAVLGVHDSWKLGLDPQPLPAPPVL